MRTALFMTLAAIMLSTTSWGQTTTRSAKSDADVTAAITQLRHIDPAKVTEADRESRAMAVQKAWETIIQAGPDGLAALKSELAVIDKSNERDDFFRLSMGPLMWQLAGVDAAEDITAAWKDTPLDVQYAYVFLTAIEAAKTHDASVLPLLKLLLKNKKGKFFVVQHVMTLAWPQTIQFAWGIFGPKGLPVLAKVLESSQDETELCSAMAVLTKAQYLPALPAIRKLAASKDVGVAGFALRCLGEFGHPQDFDLLAQGLKASNKELVFAAEYGLVEYQDLRAVPLLSDMAQSSDQRLRDEALGGLERLLNVQALEAIQANAKKYQATEEGKASAEIVDQLFKQMKLDAEKFNSLPAADKEKRLAELRLMREAKYRPVAGDRTLTREQFAEAAAGWISSHRITGGKYEWVQDRQVMQIATPADLDLLFEVRAAVLSRVSDECLEEVQILDGLIRRIGRSRYRQEVGITQKVMPVASQPATIPKQ